MFQTLTDTSMDLGSIAIFNFIFYPIRPTSYKYFLHLLSPILILLPTSPVSVTFQRCFNRSVVPASPSNFSGREATVHQGVEAPWPLAPAQKVAQRRHQAPEDTKRQREKREGEAYAQGTRVQE